MKPEDQNQPTVPTPAPAPVPAPDPVPAPATPAPATAAPATAAPAPLQPAATGPSVMPGTVAVAPSDPGKILGIIALVLSFIPFVGFVLGLVAQSKSKKAGNKNAIASIAIVLSAVFTLVGAILGGYFIIQATSKQKITTPCYTLELSKKFVKVGDNTGCNIEFETKGGKDSDKQTVLVNGAPAYDIGVAKDDYLNQIIRIYEASIAQNGVTLASPNKTKLNGSQAYQYSLSEDGEYANIIFTISPKEYSVSGSDDKVGIFNVNVLAKNSNSSSSLLKEVSNSWRWAK